MSKDISKRVLPKNFRHPFAKISNKNIKPIVKLWALRLLVPLGGNSEFIRRHGFSNDELARKLGLREWEEDGQDVDFIPQLAKEELKHLYWRMEKKSQSEVYHYSAALTKNIKQLGLMLKLTKVDLQVLEFAIIHENEPLLQNTSDYLGDISTSTLFYVISVLLNIDEKEVKKSLSFSGRLCRSGLLTVDRRGVNELRHRLDMISNNFSELIAETESDPMIFLKDVIIKSEPAKLSLDDYPHIVSEISVLKPYLKKSVSTASPGVNIFIHGMPGTGKSQLAKVIAKEVGCELFEVSSEDEDGDPIDGSRRLRSYQISQSFVHKHNSLILFDEVEDVFSDGNDLFGVKSTAQKRKAWMNRMLEVNSVPTLWLSNSLHGLDPAFVRRFDMVIELTPPRKKQRLKIIQNTCGDFLSDNTMQRVAAVEKLAPAVITRAASVLERIKDDINPSQTDSFFEMIVNNTLKTQGVRKIEKVSAVALPSFYSTDYLNSSIDMRDLANGLLKHGAGRLLLYGPPGTGKTAFGRWLSETMDKPLLVKKGSDLVSPWIGSTERNIADAFEEASYEESILMIDEVEAFLQDRRGVHANWEVSEVNEMLTQMESFNGFFVASTNMIDYLDQAALRRFDIKVSLGFLKANQLWELYKSYCKEFGVIKPGNKHRNELVRINNATPGDFAAIARRQKFNPIQSPEELTNAVKAECSVKEGVKRSIGFI